MYLYAYKNIQNPKIFGNDESIIYKKETVDNLTCIYTNKSRCFSEDNILKYRLNHEPTEILVYDDKRKVSLAINCYVMYGDRITYYSCKAPDGLEYRFGVDDGENTDLSGWIKYQGFYAIRGGLEWYKSVLMIITKKKLKKHVLTFSTEWIFVNIYYFFIKKFFLHDLYIQSFDRRKYKW